jgi:aldose 1-epimerase
VYLLVVAGALLAALGFPSWPQGVPPAPQANAPITLKRTAPQEVKRPQFVEATVLPALGMNVAQIRAVLPGRGVIDLLHGAPVLHKGEPQPLPFSFGGAFLLPFANRIRGVVSPDKKTITAEIDGKPVTMPANWKGKEEGAEVHAIHGFIYDKPFEEVQEKNGLAESIASAVLHAGNFDGHWPSSTLVAVKVVLKDSAMDIEVGAENVGKDTLPMAIGMHPYFLIPSGKREQVRLRLPATARALANNYDDVFPTGEVQAIKGTPYDFSAPGGQALGKLYLDDCFTGLKRDDSDNAVIELIDPAAHYGLRINVLSSHIHAVQVYAPPDQDFVAIEPQFNLADPFDTKVWGKRDTGVQNLVPGEWAKWHIRLELFVPAQQN